MANVLSPPPSLSRTQLLTHQTPGPLQNKKYVQPVTCPRPTAPSTFDCFCHVSNCVNSCQHFKSLKWLKITVRRTATSSSVGSSNRNIRKKTNILMQSRRELYTVAVLVAPTFPQSPYLRSSILLIRHPYPGSENVSWLKKPVDNPPASIRKHIGQPDWDIMPYYAEWSLGRGTP